MGYKQLSHWCLSFYSGVTLKDDGTHDGSIISLNWAGIQCSVIFWRHPRWRAE